MVFRKNFSRFLGVSQSRFFQRLSVSRGLEFLTKLSRSLDFCNLPSGRILASLLVTLTGSLGKRLHRN